MNFDIKTLIDLITATGALIAAAQAWRAHGESKKARTVVESFKVELVSMQQQKLNQNFTFNVATAGREPPKN
jgi:hypothetical protein